MSSRKNRSAAAAIGDRIRQLRTKRRVSLRALAEKSGVSSSMICDIENGSKSPTIAVLSAIAGALKVRLSDLVGELDGESNRVAIRRKKGSRTLVDAQGIERRQLTPEISGGNCEIIELAIPPRKATGIIGPHAPETLEYVLLMQGSLRVQVGVRHYELRAGDSITFQADVRHAYENRASSRALVYVVIEHPE